MSWNWRELVAYLVSAVVGYLVRHVTVPPPMPPKGPGDA